VGPDDVYFLGMDGGIEPLLCPVRDTAIIGCVNPDGIRVIQDPKNEQLIFGFPTSSDAIDSFWFYNYRTKAWSYDRIDATFLSNPMITQELSWLDLPSVIPTDDWDGMGVFTNWEDIATPPDPNRVLFGSGIYVYYFTTSGSLDDTTINIDTELETGDYDFNDPDLDKTITRMTLRIDRSLSNDLSFQVFGSEDGGDSWKNLKILTIDAGEREGRINFALTAQPYVLNLLNRGLPLLIL